MKSPDGSDVHGIEVREGLVLVFHRPGVPAAAALAGVRSRLGFEYEMVAVETSAGTIREIEEAMERTGEERLPDLVPIAGTTGEPN